MPCVIDSQCFKCCMSAVDPKILNALMWSHNLDKVFTENYEDDKEILWQYFGSQTGFMRSFPGKYNQQKCSFIMLPKKISGEHTVAVVSIRLSVRLSVSPSELISLKPLLRTCC
jgi:hypothetical protein